MATPVSELDIPRVTFDFADDEQHRRELARLASETWIARGAIAYPVFTYEDSQAILRDKRCYSAAGLAAELAGVQDPRVKERRRESILSAEGDVHTRLRRLVAPAFSPRAARSGGAARSAAAGGGVGAVVGGAGGAPTDAAMVAAPATSARARESRCCPVCRRPAVSQMRKSAFSRTAFS